MEDKRREKFVSLAENRVNKAIKYIKLIGNLSNKGNYKYTDDDVKKIFSTLEAEVRNTRKRYESATDAVEKVFKL